MSQGLNDGLLRIDPPKRLGDFFTDPEKIAQWRSDVWHALGGDISQYDALCHSLLNERYRLLPLYDEIHQRMKGLLGKEGIQDHLYHFYPQSYKAIKFLPRQYRDLVNSLSHLFTRDIYTYQLTELNNESTQNVLESYIAYKNLLEKALTGLQNTVYDDSIEVERDHEVIMADITTLIAFLQQDFQTTFDTPLGDASRDRIVAFCCSLLDVVDEFSSKENIIPTVYHVDRQVISHKLYSMFAVVLENKHISQRDALFIVYICSKYEQVFEYMYDLYKLFSSVQAMFSKDLFSVEEYHAYSESYDVYSNLCVLVFEENDIRGFSPFLPSRYDSSVDSYLITLLDCIRKDIYTRIRVLNKFYMSLGQREDKTILN